mgnify:CR=1 FL=1
MVTLSGNLQWFGRDHCTYAEKLIKVTSFGNLGLQNLSFAFSGARNLTEVPAVLPSTVTQLVYMFEDATSFNQDIGVWDVSGVTNMSCMFMGATSFNKNIGGWDVSNVTSMSDMFFKATSFNRPIGGWNVSCLLYTSDAADDLLCVALGGRRTIKKKTQHHHLLALH